MKNENIITVHEILDIKCKEETSYKPFVVPCDDIEMAKKIIDILGAYDMYLMDNNLTIFGGSCDCVMKSNYEFGEKKWANPLTDEELEDNTYFDRIIDCNDYIEI